MGSPQALNEVINLGHVVAVKLRDLVQPPKVIA